MKVIVILCVCVSFSQDHQQQQQQQQHLDWSLHHQVFCVGINVHCYHVKITWCTELVFREGERDIYIYRERERERPSLCVCGVQS